MKKFRNYIYCNKEMLENFINQIKELDKMLKEQESEINKKVTGELGIGIAKAEGDINESTKSKYECRVTDLENFILWCENKNNSLDLINEDITYKNKGMICTISGNAYIPEKMQDIELLESIMGNLTLLSTIPGIDEESMKVSQILKNSDKIPILVELHNDKILSCQITKKYLIENINDFFESMEDEISIIGRIDNVYEDGRVEIFDIAKEMLKVNRTVRRKMKEEQLKDVIVYEDAPLIKITPLIIYK